MDADSRDVYFFDDLEENVKAAQEISLRAIQVQELTVTEAALRSARLL
jgi:hypothetical protein